VVHKRATSVVIFTDLLDYVIVAVVYSAFLFCPLRSTFRAGSPGRTLVSSNKPDWGTLLFIVILIHVDYWALVALLITQCLNICYGFVIELKPRLSPVPGLASTNLSNRVGHT
jgi:hypothetical protein